MSEEKSKELFAAEFITRIKATKPNKRQSKDVDIYYHPEVLNAKVP